MDFTLDMTDDEADASRHHSEQNSRTLQDVAREAVGETGGNNTRADLLDQVLDEGLPRYAGALDRLGQ